jgi:hypothetical protein
MKKLITILLLIATGYLYSQDTTTVKIMGHYSGAKNPLGCSMLITFEENMDKCDPVYGYETLEEIIYKFEIFLKEKNVLFDGFESVDTLDIYKGDKRKAKFEYKFAINKDVKELYKIYWASKSAFAKDVDFYVQYAPKEFSDEDISAIGALHNALEKVKVYAKELGKENIEIVNIDDLTTGYWSGFTTNYDFTRRKLENIQDDLNVASSYGLLVTFNLY